MSNDLIKELHLFTDIAEPYSHVGKIEPSSSFTHMSCTFVIGPGGSGKSHYSQQFENAIIYRERRPSIGEIEDLMANDEHVIVEVFTVSEDEKKFVLNLKDKGKFVYLKRTSISN